LVYQNRLSATLGGGIERSATQEEVQHKDYAFMKDLRVDEMGIEDRWAARIEPGRLGELDGRSNLSKAQFESVATARGLDCAFLFCPGGKSIRPNLA
jgi:hypothetical protein